MGLSGDSSFHAALSALFEAALDGQLWPKVIDRVARYGSAAIEALTLTIEQQEAGEGSTALPVAEWVRPGRGPPPRRGKVGPTRARRGDDPHAHPRAAAANARPGDPPPFECRVPVADGDVAVLRAYFSPCEAAERSRSERRLAALAPHVLQALRISRSLEHLVIENAARRQVLDSLRTAVFLLDGSGRVMATNAAGARLADAHDGLGIGNRLLSSNSRRGDRSLQELIGHVLQPADFSARSPGHILQLPRPSGHAPYYVRAMALGRTGDRADGTRGGAVVLVIDTTQKIELCRELLMKCFRLTPREAAIAVELANGSDVSRCAAALHMKRNTVRAHQRQVYRKTGTRRQAELVRLLLDLPLAPVGAAAGPALAREPEGAAAPPTSSRRTSTSGRVDGLDEPPRVDGIDVPSS